MGAVSSSELTSLFSGSATSFSDISHALKNMKLSNQRAENSGPLKPTTLRGLLIWDQQEGSNTRLRNKFKEPPEALGSSLAFPDGSEYDGGRCIQSNCDRNRKAHSKDDHNNAKQLSLITKDPQGSGHTRNS